MVLKVIFVNYKIVLLKDRFIKHVKENKVLLGRFIFSGLSSMMLELFLFYVFFNVLSIYPVISNNLSLLIAGIFNYFLSRYWVFEKTSNPKREVMLFAIIFFVSLLVNNAIFIFSIRIFGFSPLLSKCTAIFISTGFNYITKKYLVFKEFEPVAT